MICTIGVIGLGDIAVRRHIPAIRNNRRFRLLATSSQRGVSIDDVPHSFRTAQEMLALDDLDAVAICTPPAARHELARAALLAGKHVLLEKPTTVSLGEAHDLAALARRVDRTIYTTWHSQQNLAVRTARDLLRNAGMRKLEITWNENVLATHAGQQWIWQPGGFGVFDAGINPLSIASYIAPRPLIVRSARLDVPAGAQTPARVKMTLATNGQGNDISSAAFDWLRPQTERLFHVVCDDGRQVELRDSGGTLVVDGEIVITGERREYDMIYEDFASLLNQRQSHFDVEPLRIVADALLTGERHAIEPVAA